MNDQCPKCAAEREYYPVGGKPHASSFYMCGTSVNVIAFPDFQTDRCRIRERDAELATLRAENERLKRLAPLCKGCGSGEGTRSGCPYCALQAQGISFHEIDLAVHGDNEYHTSLYDADMDHERVTRTAAQELERLRAENERLRLRIQSAAGDDLCRLTQEEIKAYTSGAVQIPPREEFIASCERFHEQIASGPGVLSNCLTLAQLVAENERLLTVNAKLLALCRSVRRCHRNSHLEQIPIEAIHEAITDAEKASRP